MTEEEREDAITAELEAELEKDSASGDDLAREDALTAELELQADLDDNPPKYIEENEAPVYGKEIGVRDVDQAPLTPEEVEELGMTQEQYDNLGPLREGYVARIDPQVAEYVQDAGFADAFQTSIIGPAEFSKDNGVLWSLLNAVGGVGQATARAGLAVMNTIGAIPLEDARDMMSQQQFDWHDLINYSWRPETRGGERARFVVGLLADVIVDPLNVFSLGKIAKGFRGFSSMERMKIRQVEQIKRIVTKSGDVLHIDDAKGMQNWVTSQEQSVESLIANLDIEGKTLQNIIDDIARIKADPTYAQDLRLGIRKPEWNVKIPFTDIGFGGKADWLAKAQVSTILGVSHAKGALFKTYGKIAESVPLAAGLGRILGKGGALMGTAFTKTGRLVADFGMQKHSNNETAVQRHLSQSKERGYEVINKLPADLQDDFRDYAERFMTTEQKAEAGARHILKLKEKQKATALDRLKNPNKYKLEPTKKSRELSKAKQEISLSNADSVEDVARRKRLMEHPDGPAAIEYLENIQGESDRLYKMMRQRYPWLEELYPIGSGKDFARVYLQHMVDRNFRKLYATKEEAEAAADLYKTGMKTDKAAYRRQAKTTISAQNKRAGEQVIESDTIYLHNKRLNDMSKQINDHDLLESLFHYVSTTRKPGYERLTLNSLNIDKKKLLNLTDPGDARNMLPIGYRKLLAAGKELYMPRSLVYRVKHLVNPSKSIDMGTMMMKVISTPGYLYTKAKLWGTDYLGQNSFGNMLTGMYAGSGVNRYGSALELVEVPFKTAKPKMFKVGGREIARDDFMNELVQNGIIGNVFIDSVSWRLVNDSMGSAQRQGLGRFGKTLKALNSTSKVVGEVATGYKTMRHASRIGDELPKVAMYMDLLDKGYTKAGAAEEVLYWFHDFKNMTPQQRFLSKIFPFTSFALKTAEQHLTVIKAGKNLNHMSIPSKVSSMFEGLYIDDPETEKFLGEILPDYRKSQDNIFGPMMGGGQYIMLDIPWAISTIPMLMNPKGTLSPMIKVIGAMLNEDFSDRTPEEEEMDIHYFLNNFISPPMAHAMAVGEMSEYIDVPLVNYKKANSAPARSDRSPEEYKAALIGTGELYRELDKKFGDNWAYNLFFFGDPSDPLAGRKRESTIGDLQRDAMYSKFLGKYLRDFAFGTARLESLDKNFIVSYSAAQRRLTPIKKQMGDIRNKNWHLNSYQPRSSQDNIDILNKLNKQEHITNYERLLAESIEIETYQNTLKGYYAAIKRMQIEFPNSLENLLTGGGELYHGSIPEYYLDRDRAKMKMYDNLSVQAENKRVSIGNKQLDPLDFPNENRENIEESDEDLSKQLDEW